MKKEFEKEQRDNQIDDAFLDMPDMDDDEKFSQWLEDEYLKEADAIEESLFAGRKFEDNQDVAEKLSVSRESFYQRMREEGMLEEETVEESVTDTSDEESSDKTAEMPAVEESEKKILEFRKNPETSKEVANSTEKVVSIEKKSSVKKKHSYVRFGKIAGIACLCLICVFAASMSSEANRNYFIKSVRYLAGDDTKFIVDNDIENEAINTNEYEAMQDIEDKLEVDMPEFYYRPYGMEFLNYEINQKALYAKLEYEYEDTILIFYIDKQNGKKASNVSSINGTEKVVSNISKENFNVTVKEIEDEKDKCPTYVASWTYEDNVYSWIGKISLDEIEKMIKEMKF